jgi:intein/homing endonuclease
VIPEKLAQYFEVIDCSGLTPEESKAEVEKFCEELKVSVPPNSDQVFHGMTSYGIESAITLSAIKTKKNGSRQVDPAFVADYKRAQIRKTDLVSLLDPRGFSFDAIGGADRFKAWVKETSSCWTEEGQKFGLKPPRGVLLVGVYGCGKSLSAKALAAEWKLPLVQFEMGKIRSSGVGDSESNLYKALAIVDSIAPCVTSETEVTLEDGSITTIKELWEEQPENLRVKCWDDKTLKVSSTQVRAITRREAEAFRVEAANGYYLNATGNHKHYVLRGGMPEWVTTDDLQVGDMLGVPLVEGGWGGNKDCSRFFPKGIRTFTKSDGSTELRLGGGGYKDSRIPKLPKVWTTGLGYLVGMIEGDGFLGKSGSIGFVNTSECLLDKFEELIYSLFGSRASRRKNEIADNLPGLSATPEFKPCWTTKINSKMARDFLLSLRENILTAPSEVRKAFLAGWLDADGCIGPEKVILTIRGTKQWLEKRSLVRNLIQSLGVTPSNFEGINLEITGSRATKLASIVGKYLVLKKVKSGKVTHSPIGFDRGMGFACGELLASSRKSSKLTFAALKVSSSITWGCENGSKKLSERHLQDYIKVLGSHAKELNRLFEAECRWVEIRAIESIGTQDVYDLVCEGTNTRSFFANGLITHNCMLWIDEAEKSLAGSASSAQSDAGTTSRLLGILSTWAQESKKPVCIVMTANSLAGLPAEMVNRMPERFFFDIPDEDTRVEIIKIQAKAVNQDASGFNLIDLADKAKLLVGREIEQAVGSAMTRSFNAGKPALDEEILGEELARKPRIVKTMGDEIKTILDWVGYDSEIGDGIRARLASKGRSESFKIHSAK